MWVSVNSTFFRVSQVLLNDNEKLSNFRSPSVKKKPLENQTVSSSCIYWPTVCLHLKQTSSLPLLVFHSILRQKCNHCPDSILFEGFRVLIRTLDLSFRFFLSMLLVSTQTVIT